MKTNETGDDEVSKEDASGGERRSNRRYGMQLQLRWKLVHRRRALDSGTGWTVNMSSGGIMIETGVYLPAGSNVELSIVWPVLLHEVTPMQLIINGRIVRCSERGAAIRIAAHEFRTLGALPERRPMPREGKPSSELFRMENPSLAGVSR
jgi:hypothetical protein